MKFKANFQYKPGNFQMDDCQIEKVVELTHAEFCKLKITPMENQPCVMENNDCMFSKDGIMHCLLALGQGSNDGILIDAEGYNYPRYAAYIPGMRDIINAEMDRAADFIIRQGVENTGSGNWCMYFEELEEKLGLTVREGNGLDTMLLDAIARRPEVAEVELVGDCIDTTYYLDYCKHLEEQSGSDVPTLSQERKAALFDHAVASALTDCVGVEIYTALHDQLGMRLSEIRACQYLSDKQLSEIGKNVLLLDHEKFTLVAVYEELCHIPESERVTALSEFYSGYCLRQSIDGIAALAAYEKALDAIHMSGDEFHRWTAEGDDEGREKEIIAKVWDCIPEPDVRIRDVLDWWPEYDCDFAMHPEADQGISMQDIAKLTNSGREDFAALLDAKVETIRTSESNLEVVVSGVEPQELERFSLAHGLHEESEQAMGPVM